MVVECVKNVDVVFICVGNDDDVCSMIMVVIGVIFVMKLGVVLIDYIMILVLLVEELLVVV